MGDHRHLVATVNGAWRRTPLSSARSTNKAKAALLARHELESPYTYTQTRGFDNAMIASRNIFPDVFTHTHKSWKDLTLWRKLNLAPYRQGPRGIYSHTRTHTHERTHPKSEEFSGKDAGWSCWWKEAKRQEICCAYCGGVRKGQAI